MGNDDAGAFQAVQGLRHLLLGDVVQGAGGLVKNQQLGLGGDGPGNHQPLALPTGDAALSLGNQGVHSHGHGPDVVGNARQLSGLPGFLQGQPRGGDGDVLVNTALEQLSVLNHSADIPPQGAQVQRLHVLPIVINGALLGCFHAQQQPHQGGFAAAGFAHDRHILP